MIFTLTTEKGSKIVIHDGMEVVIGIDGVDYTISIKRNEK